MTMEPKISKKGPCVMEMQPGKYFWCGCRRTAKPPYCDGAHNKL
ncbi:MAG: CDGSH iron-sulfur domain-containing protein [Proteobacteria bacterium]|nr:CDGSH iron-sulfur domain-containing protein [Pseudomonadota bacterium]MBU4121980.1 CDGSH iron-sulfur domain-containing protein [Pseudomonadota bacterium]